MLNTRCCNFAFAAAGFVAVALSTRCLRSCAPFFSGLRRPLNPCRTLIGVLVGTAGCFGGDCIQMPCPLPTAVMVVAVSATGAPLTGLFVDVGTPAARVACDVNSGRCVVPGGAGIYTLSIGATGYQTMRRSVTVTAVPATGRCGCAGVNTQQLQLTLVRLWPACRRTAFRTVCGALDLSRVAFDSYHL